jgi:LCP family protein required for cell wall assembly
MFGIAITHKEPMMRRPLFTALVSLAAAGLIIIFVSLFVQLASIRKESSQDAAKIFFELESMAGQQGEVEQAIRTLGEENNSLRRALNLPEKSYDFFPAESGTAGGDASSPAEELPFYQAVDTLLEHRRELALAEMVGRLAEAGNADDFLTVGGLEFERAGMSGLYVMYRGTRLAELRLEHGEAESGESPGVGYRLISGDGGSELLSGGAEEFGAAGGDVAFPAPFRDVLERLLREEAERERLFGRASALLTELHSDAEAAGIRRERSLRFSAPEMEGRVSRFTVTTRDGIELFTVSAVYGDRALMVGGSPFSPEERESALARFRSLLEEADSRIALERATDEGKARVASMAEDEAFNAYLGQKGLSLSSSEREDNDYFYFDLLDGEGKRAGSIAVQKGIGELYLMDGEDVSIGSLRSLGLLSGKDVSSESFDLPDDDQLARMGNVPKEGKTILLCGTHENNADTIMIAHVDPEKATLIALPRDLWWKQRKLNAYFSIYGPERFKEIVSEITELQIDDYIVVDMYAFIDVINILGGVEVTLEEDLIDPTYKIRDNGVWKTLHYKKGTHLLDGIAALRVARSRHGSDDFDRARRQQLVISGIKDRFDGMSAGEVKTVYRLVQTISTYVDTSFSSFELARLYLQNRNAGVDGGGVVSTDNVLLATYSNLLATGKSEEDVDDDFPKGAWILVPRENNWKLIPWYVNRLIGGGS